MAATRIAQRSGMVAVPSSILVPVSSPASASCSLREISLNVDASALSLSVTHTCLARERESLRSCFVGGYRTKCPNMLFKQAPGMRTKMRRLTVVSRAATGSAAMLAKEMERVAAKEALLLAIKDAGGLKGLGNPAEDDKARIDVNEKVLNLERLNPTPRPTTSSDLEGLWRFEWAAARSPGIIAASTILGNFPPALASIDSLTLLILEGSTKATGTIRVFNAVESSFTLVTKLTIEGPVRLKEEYAEGLISSPAVLEGSGSSPLAGLFRQMSNVAAQLPVAVRDAVGGGLRLPLSGTFSRVLLISYLDDEVLIARDKSGVPDVLQRVVATVA